VELDDSAGQPVMPCADPSRSWISWLARGLNYHVSILIKNSPIQLQDQPVMREALTAPEDVHFASGLVSELGLQLNLELEFILRRSIQRPLVEMDRKWTVQ
jgi:hypothetical protein